eukprot:1193189-Prorocentrum_minimum.AAC.1
MKGYEGFLRVNLVVNSCVNKRSNNNESQPDVQLPRVFNEGIQVMESSTTTSDHNSPPSALVVANFSSAVILN